MKKTLGILSFLILLANLAIIFSPTKKDDFPIVVAPIKTTRLKDYPYVNLDIPKIPGQEYGPGVETYTYSTPEENELEGVQVPIPRDCRILNTKGNCVWCSLEVLGRYAWIEKVYNITKNVSDGGDPRCQGGSSPEPVRRFLNDKKIKYEMATTRSESEKLLLKACKIDRRGAAFGIPGHMLNIIHYDPDTRTIKVIDNADRSLSVQTWSWDKFYRLWDGWCYYIVGEPDLIENRYLTLADRIPIFDRNTDQGKYPKGYIPIPKKD